MPAEGLPDLQPVNAMTEAAITANKRNLDVFFIISHLAFYGEQFGEYQSTDPDSNATGESFRVSRR
jgi:hypothetical protein